MLIPSTDDATTTIKLCKIDKLLKMSISIALRYGSGSGIAKESKDATPTPVPTPIAPQSLLQLYRIPFLLIEDILEGETIANIEKFWVVLEGLIDIITLPEMFSRGKFMKPYQYIIITVYSYSRIQLNLSISIYIYI